MSEERRISDPTKEQKRKAVKITVVYWMKYYFLVFSSFYIYMHAKFRKQSDIAIQDRYT